MTARNLIAALAMLASSALAPAVVAEPAPQAPMAMPDMTRTPWPIPHQPGAIALNTGSVPGMPAEVWELFLNQPTARNVSRATLTPVLPKPANATGAAIIVAPGGGFYGLSMVAEGSAVAQWLADRGIAAFVLKYRLNPTPAKPADVDTFIQRTMMESMAAKGQLEFPTPPQSLQDAQAALRLVRSRAAEWGVDPERVGMLGFSAGAILSLSATLAEGTDKPDFLGLIYPPLDAVAVPAKAPPLYISIAADDPLFAGKGYGLAESWGKAGRPVELHVYQKGGHGYGLGVAGETTRNWAPGFADWLQMNGLLGGAEDESTAKE